MNDPGMSVHPPVLVALERVGRGCGASRAYVFLTRQRSDGSRFWENTHEWCAEGVEPQIAQLQDVPTEVLPYWASRIDAGLGVLADPLDRLPPEAAAERDLLAAQDVHTIVVVPIIGREGSSMGFVGLDGVGPDHPGWPPHASDWLASVGAALAAAFEAESDARKQAEHVAQRQHRIAELDAILPVTGGVVHDLANLLAIVMLNAELVMDTTVPTDERLHSFADIGQSGSRAEAMLRRLLALIRGTAPPVRPIRADAFLAELAALLHRAYQPRVRVVFQGNAPDAVVTMAPTDLDQIVLNLVVNARDASPNGGIVQIRTRADVGQRLLIEVTDQGPGVPDVIKAIIFEPFYTTKRDSGTGLGLFNVAQAAAARGGEVRVLDAPGARGACFQVWLPCDQAAVDGPVATPDVERRLDGVRVLVVDDERALRVLVREALARRGAAVREAGSVTEALALADQHDVDVLITDLELPDGWGVTLAQQLRSRAPTLPVVCVTAEPDGPAAVAASAAGLDVLNKPFRRDTLLRWVARAAAAKR